MLARSGETLDKVVRHLLSWTSWRQDDAPIIEATWKRELTRLNPNLPAGNILEGQRINLPTDAEMVELLNAAKPVKQLAPAASNR